LVELGRVEEALGLLEGLVIGPLVACSMGSEEVAQVLELEPELLLSDLGTHAALAAGHQTLGSGHGTLEMELSRPVVALSTDAGAFVVAIDLTSRGHGDLVREGLGSHRSLALGARELQGGGVGLPGLDGRLATTGLVAAGQNQTLNVLELDLGCRVARPESADV